MDKKEQIKLYRAFYIIGDQAILRILFELERNGEKNFTELKNNLHLNPSTLSKKLKLLLKLEFVSADRTHDKLRVYYSIQKDKKLIKRILDSIELLAQEI